MVAAKWNETDLKLHYTFNDFSIINNIDVDGKLLADLIHACIHLCSIKTDLIVECNSLIEWRMIIYFQFQINNFNAT